MNKVLLAAMLLCALIFAGSITAYFTLTRSGQSAPPIGHVNRSGGKDPLKPDQGWEGIKIPAFTGTSQIGDAVTEAVLDGRITVLDFIFTNCPLACPSMTAQMQALSSELSGTHVRFLSLSIDPKNDTPAVLKAYADNVGADQSRWVFVSGDQTQIRGIVTDVLMFDIQEDKARSVQLADGSTMFNLLHPTQFFLVGPDRQILGIYQPSDAQQFEMLRDRAKAAALALGTSSR